MALNHTEKLILSLIVDRFVDLQEEEELRDFTEERIEFDKNHTGGSLRGEVKKINCVSLFHLYRIYPKYSLTKKLLEFGQMVAGYLYDPTFVVCNPTTRASVGFYNQKFEMKLRLLGENGVKIEYTDMNAIQRAVNPNPEVNKTHSVDDVTVFAIKVNDFYVDFNLRFAQKEIKGVGEGVYSMATLQSLNNQPRVVSGRISKQEEVENYERQVLRLFNEWSTTQALNFIKQSRHFRRQGLPLQDIVIQQDVNSYFIAPPKNDAEEGPDNPTDPVS